jgi:NAD(P)-dependent dehydrogenase (short-subunit alcohol dehydrogenase family)
MDLGITGLRVLVTAGAGGIGHCIARAFNANGARTHVCDIDTDRLRALEATDRTITAWHCDVADRSAVESLFERIEQAMGGIDCLVNNAGIAGPTGRVDLIEPVEWDRTFSVNVTGQFNCARKAVPLLVRSNNPSMINMASAAGRLGFRHRSPYSASKWAVIGFSKSLAMELGEFGVRVNAILPGIVAGERQDAVLSAKAGETGADLEEMRMRALDRASIKRMIKPEEIADMVLFLASERARTVSGQAISICGDLQSLS